MSMGLGCPVSTIGSIGFTVYLILVVLEPGIKRLACPERVIVILVCFSVESLDYLYLRCNYCILI